MSYEEEPQKRKETCEKCHDTGIVKDADGSCHTCWDCMNEGRLNQHTEGLPDNSQRYKL
jgi:DnaJ-class molecular chaperone